MQRIVYPGSFCPPTYGHLAVLRAAVLTFPELTVVCSRNPEKQSNWGTPEECVALWSAYKLPADENHLQIQTLEEVQESLSLNNPPIMIRGLRSNDDLPAEADVMTLNRDCFGIKQYHYICAETEHADISSSRARRAALECDFESLAHCVAPLVVSFLLERAFRLRNIFLVVGKPGTGKSTLLGILERLHPAAYVIRTDSWSGKMQQLLRSHFSVQNLTPEFLLQHEREAETVLKDAWFAHIRFALQSAPAGSDVFVEVGYALRPEKALYRFLGGKILHVDGGTESTSRLRGRGTPQHQLLAEQIPNTEASRAIAKEQRLKLHVIRTDCSLQTLQQKMTLLTACLGNGTIPEEI